MGDRIRGKVALVTGAASGIGAACVERFTEEGAVVAGLDVSPKPEHSKAASWWHADVADEDAVRTAVDAVAAEHNGLDIVVNAAGVISIGNAQELDLAEWERVIGINLKGTWLVSKHAVGHLVERGSGSIINLASIEGLEGFSGQTAYNVSKGGVVLLTRNMATDFGPKGVRINCLCPGLIETPLTAMLQEPGLEKVRDTFVGWHLLGRAGQPEEVAACALFLASDDASFVHGSALVVDGGMTAGRRFLSVSDEDELMGHSD